MADGDTLFDITVKRYEQEVGRKHHLDTKAGTQIGFAGIIIAILQKNKSFERELNPRPLPYQGNALPG